MNKSHLTATTRRDLSPAYRWLLKERLLRGPGLDFGCGRGFEAAQLGWVKYDPHFFPATPVGPFKTIMCQYVLNVIESEADRTRVLEAINELLCPATGVAFIVVRRDVPKPRYSSIGTFQAPIDLDLLSVKRTSGYEIYMMPHEPRAG